MNKLIVFFFLFSFIYAADANKTSNININKQIENMKEIRKIDSSILQDIVDPFYRDGAISGVPSNVFTRTSSISDAKNSATNKIQAIVGHKVKINNNWYSINDKINDQKITNILKDSIILENDSGEQSIEIIKKEYNNEIYVK